MIAALPMYDRPALRGAHDRLWQGFRDHLPDAPESLCRDQDWDVWDLWRAPDLLLAQTCGLPYRARLHGQVTLVASPDHGLPDCPPGQYRSRLIRRAGDRRSLDALARGILAINDGLSQSGWAAPLAHLEAAGLRPAAVRITEAHAASVQAVARGDADWAAIDAVTWAMVQTEGAGDGLEVFDSTAPTPALPYITAPGRDPAPIGAALEGAIAALAAADRKALCLHGLVSVPASAYLALPIPAAPPGD